MDRPDAGLLLLVLTPGADTGSCSLDRLDVSRTVATNGFGTSGRWYFPTIRVS